MPLLSTDSTHLRTATAVERLRRPDGRYYDMSSSDGGGLMSSAGLVRYFDAEDNNAIRIDPRTIIAFGVLFGALILVLNAFV
jgi:preprotein translocase subunit Sec61beta